MKKGMYNNRWYHICKAIVIINRGGGNIGNTALARDVGISRQAMNRVMIDAVKYGWVTVSEIEWRPNVMAKRYHPSKKGMQAVEDPLADLRTYLDDPTSVAQVPQTFV